MKAAFHTLGCKVNSYETQAMTEQFIKAGFEITDFTMPADVYVVNTCSVTSMAEHKSRQLIHRTKKLNPDAVVVACGCYAQRVGEELLKDEVIDIVIGNNNKSKITDMVISFIEGKETRNSCVDDLTHCRDYETQHISSLGENVRAYVKIQDGCNRFCSYCIIPYVRGRSRCRNSEDIIEEIKGLAKNGYKEIVLTGIDISMYEDMPHLLEEIEKIDEIKRIRLGSLEAGVITDDFIVKFSKLKKVCPHFHLSLQSGCDETLKRMNRHYTADEFEKKVELLRECIPGCAITTDVIVGFAGETEEEFAKSLAFVKKTAFAQTHVFKYSRREGTAADKMPGQVPEAVKTARSAEMIEAADKIKYDFEKNLIGSSKAVLFEEAVDTKDGRRIQIGFTPEYIKVGAESEEDLINSIRNVEICSFTETENGRVLLGKLK